ncbi:MAG: hypothetical protein LBP59_07710 [Planctomycetaceae bacterium]|jgi:hypothetical protein|nr:hypothetical protein [Planctomycetaceae bacterium]
MQNQTQNQTLSQSQTQNPNQNPTQIQIQKFDELHFFIVESGFFDKVKETFLIGGLLLFGKYDETVQKKLREILVDSLSVIDKKYPQDTSFYAFLENDATKRQGKQFASALAKNLSALTPDEDNRTAYGLLMFQNIHDIHDNLPTLFAQNELNNRYVSMLWSLIEHTIFVSDRAAKKLNSGAKFHVHIAARSYVIDLDKTSLKSAKALELNMKKNAEPKNTEPKNTEPNDAESKDAESKNADVVTYTVTPSIDADEIKNLFDVAINERWSTSDFKLETVETCELIFDKKIKKSDEPTPGLYLANTLLGIERTRLVRSQLIADPALPILESLIYDQNLDSTAICKSNYCNGNITSLIETLEHYPLDPNSQQNQEIVRILIKEYAKNSEQFYRLFDAAKNIAGNAKNRKHGNDLARLVEHIHRMSDKTDLLADFYSILIQFITANQSNYAIKSFDLWRIYLPKENSLPKLGVKNGLKIGAEFRCRRAVNLMEQFNFDLAEQVMIEIGTQNDDFCQAMAKFFNVPVEQIDMQEISNCYDTLAQVFAFQAFDQYKRKLSELFFRKALTATKNPASQIRIWTHLGHLACDFPKQLKPLWDEVLTNLPTTGDYIDDGIKTPHVIAIRLKGALVFGNNELKKELTETMDVITRNYAYEIINSFPYGLILQTLAMLNAELGNKKRANKLFEKTIRSLESSEQSARPLATIAKIRHTLFNLESNPNINTNISKNKFLHSNIRQFISYLPKSQISKQLHEATLNPDQQNTQQNAKRILNLIRFIHW